SSVTMPHWRRLAGTSTTSWACWWKRVAAGGCGPRASFNERRCMKSPRSSRAPLIFDVGLNTGQDTPFYLAQGYRVVAIEADPALAAAACRRFEREIGDGRLEVVNVGISDRDGFADFWICDSKPEFNSFCRTIAARDALPHHAIRVPVV